MNGKPEWPLEEDRDYGVNFVLYGENGTLDYSKGAICMASLAELSSGEEDENGFLYKETSKEVKKIMPLRSFEFWSKCPEEYNSFLKWLVEDSFWSECFINSFNEISKTRVALMNINQPVQFVIGACCMIRATWEHSPCIELWMKGVNNLNLTPEEAIVYAFANQNEPPLTRLNCWHCPIEFASIEGVDAFIKGEPFFFKNVSFAENTGYGGFTSIFDKEASCERFEEKRTKGLPERYEIPQFLIERRNCV